MIKVIHQTWKDSNPPEDIFRPDWVSSWTTHNPEWGYRLWTDDDIRDFVRDEFPRFFPIWCSYPKQIMRVDAWRYLLLKRQGGLYVDLDIASLRPLEPWIEKFHRFSCADQGDGNLCNALMWAPAPDSPFLEDIVAGLTAAAYEPDPLDAAGPRFLQQYAARRMWMVSQMPTSNVFPVTVWDRDPLWRASQTPLDMLSQTYADAVAISFWAGSWIEQPNSLVEQPISTGFHFELGLNDFFFAVIASPGREELCCGSESYYESVAEISLRYWKPQPPPESDSDFIHGNFSGETGLTAVLADFVLSNKAWIFVCSEATYFVPGRLSSLLRKDVQFVANESVLVERSPNRDAGYLISRSLAEAIVASESVHTEADLACYLSGKKIPVEVTPLLRHDRFRYPTYSNQVVSAAFDDPRQFAVIPQLLQAENLTTIPCIHYYWRGDLEFLAGGGCIRPATGCCGFWKPVGNKDRRIFWFDWPEEIMLRVGDDLGIVIQARHVAGFVD